jgi:hypothetical protein
MPTQRHIRPFTWVMGVLVVALLASGAGSAALAAKASSSTIDHRPLLKVGPKNVGIAGDGINCNGPHSGAYTWICHVTLTELKSSDRPLHWFTRSDRPAKFTPSKGQLSPGQSVKVIIATNFCGGFTNFYFVGPKNVATVQYQCG